MHPQVTMAFNMICHDLTWVIWGAPNDFGNLPSDREGDMLHQRPAQGAGDEEAAEGVGPQGAEKGGKSQGPKPRMAWRWLWKFELV